MKILDVLVIQKYYRTKEQILKDGLPTSEEEMKDNIASRPNFMESLLNSSWLRELGKSGRIVSEDAMKLRDFRKMKYGQFSELTPANPSIHPSIPLPTSFAQPYIHQSSSGDGEYADLPEESLKWSYLAGQKLQGNMIYFETQSTMSFLTSAEKKAH